MKVKNDVFYLLDVGGEKWIYALKNLVSKMKSTDEESTSILKVDTSGESLIENVHREDLAPMERARGLAEVFRLVGFEPTKVAEVLNNKLKWIPERRKLSDLTAEEKRIKEIADMIALEPV